MPSQETEAAVEVEVLIDASPETVFEFFTDAEKMILWMGRTAELEARPGGAFRCDMNGRDVALGEFVEVDPPRRAVFTWGWEGEGVAVEPGASTVEILLAPEGDGTRLRLAHRDLPSPESAARHRGGWEHFTTRLAVAASGGDPGADPWATAT